MAIPNRRRTEQHEFYAFLFVVPLTVENSGRHKRLSQCGQNSKKMQTGNNIRMMIPLRRCVIVLAILLFHNYFAAAQEAIRTDIPLRVYRCSLSGMKTIVEKGQIIDVYFIVENYRKQRSPEVEFKIVVPNNIIIIYGDKKHVIDTLPYRNTQGVLYKLTIDQAYQGTTIPIEVWMSNDEGILSPCYQADIRIGQSESFANITPITKSTLSDASSDNNKIETSIKKPTERYRIVVGSKLNVRQRPSSQSKIVGTLYNGDYVEVYDFMNNWAEIKYNQKHAYISANYIEKDPLPKVDDTLAPSPKEPTIQPQIEPIAIEKKETKQVRAKGKFDIIISAAVGLSNLYSPDAYSYGTIGGMVESGVRTKLGFLPQNIFVEATMGFALLGNSQYTFPGFAINVVPFGIEYKLLDYPFYTQIGATLILGGTDIYVSRGSFHSTYYANSTINIVIKEAVEIGNYWDFGLVYLHGLNNVCGKLPIELHHSSIQLFGTYKIKIK